MLVDFANVMSSNSCVTIPQRLGRAAHNWRPDTVAHELNQLVAAGLTGIAVSFVNYTRELPYFCDEVLPRLVKMGLRQK